MKNIFMFSILLFFISVQAVHSQIAINTRGASSDQSAILDVNAADKGFLIPGGRIVETALFVNGVRHDDLHARLWLKDGLKSHNISLTGLISLSADDMVTVGFTVDDSAIIKIEMANLSLTKID